MKLFLAPILAFALPAMAAVDLGALQDAARARKITQLEIMAHSARGDLLEMYPRYHLLAAQIETLSETEANDFLNRYANTPLAERFRSEWLKELGRRQAWSAFLGEFGKLESPDVDLRCLNAQAQSAQGRTEAVLPLRALWFSGNPRPESCGPVFDALFASGKLTLDDVWQRIRLALTEGRLELASTLANRIGAGAINHKALTRITQNPEKHVIDSGSRAGREMALYALSRLARTDPDKAALRLEQVTDWPAADTRAAWQAIALIAARKHHPKANAWFELAGRDLTVDAGAWSVRAALRQQDWQRALERIDLLPERNEATWRYWRGRALSELGRKQEANAQWIAMADGHDYYNLLAREELGAIAEPPNIQYRPNDDEMRSVSSLPGIQRAFALLEGGWRAEAIREWAWALRGQPDQRLLAAAELARRQGWYDRAIYASERTRGLHDFSTRFLAPYHDIVEPQAARTGLEAAWVYGLMRQESRFVNTARSSVGAGGLMQLMPATAQWVARKLGWKKLEPGAVNDIETNVTLGTTYLQHIWQQLGNSEVLATAGYNAGPGRARQWQGEAAMDATIYIETIPFSETRDYVKKVMANAMHYANVFRAPTRPLKARIGIIPPRGGSINDTP